MKRKKQARDGSDEENPDDGDGGGEGGGSGAPSGLDDFFGEVATIKSALDRIKLGLRKLESAHEESKTVTRAAKMKELRDRMEKAGNDVTVLANEAKKGLEALEKSNAAARLKKGCEEGSSQDRTRGSITMSLTKKMRDLMGSFAELREKLQADYKEVVERRYQAIHGKKARAQQALASSRVELVLPGNCRNFSVKNYGGFFSQL